MGNVHLSSPNGLDKIEQVEIHVPRKRVMRLKYTLRQTQAVAGRAGSDDGGIWSLPAPDHSCKLCLSYRLGN